MVWEYDGEEKGGTAEEGGEEDKSRGAPAREKVVSEGGHSVTSSDSRPLTCGAGSVGNTQGNELEQQPKATWAWKRQGDALEGARDRTGDGVLVEHMYGKDVNSLWAVLCALEGRPSSEEGCKR